ncbi:hypothetical protein VSH64_44285 [Amycolatopsis rhabdoformis]|uniref:Uncharacterized protein n=1 Tax=Amycolatopsis rhabdoformis TaxID=1448059 RepID=A0ABZ1I5N6_9PSEU|nr:hypothetical protein [Amycolatopsis rhabdoformis]WSE29737.1 hypothetical protein VSH64_44285 [Amycolatopsis rhabdoformis]
MRWRKVSPALPCHSLMSPSKEDFWSSPICRMVSAIVCTSWLSSWIWSGSPISMSSGSRRKLTCSISQPRPAEIRLPSGLSANFTVSTAEATTPRPIETPSAALSEASAVLMSSQLLMRNEYESSTPAPENLFESVITTPAPKSGLAFGSNVVVTSGSPLS